MVGHNHGGGCATEEIQVEMRIPTIEIPDDRGGRMALAREKAGLTQDDMAKVFKRSHSTINKWEHGAQPTDLVAILKKWSELTKAPVWWMLCLEPPEGDVIGRSSHLGSDLLEQLDLLAA